MTLLYRHDKFLEHRTGAGHPERPERYQTVINHQPFQTVAAQCVQPSFEPLTLQQLTSVHDPGVGAYVQAAVAQGGGQIEADTFVVPASLDVGLLAAGACTSAVTAVMQGQARNAFCLVRPP